MLLTNLFVTMIISALTTYLIWVIFCWGSKKRAILNLTFGMFPIFFAIVDLIYAIEVWRRYDQGIQFPFFFFCFIAWLVIADYGGTKRIYCDDLDWSPVLTIGIVNLVVFALSIILLNII